MRERRPLRRRHRRDVEGHVGLRRWTRSALNGDCPAATALVGTFLNRSTISYGADMTYSFAGDVSGDIYVSVPAECLASGETCADVEQQLLTEPDFASIGCMSRAWGCDCQQHQPHEEVMEAGTFTVTAAGLLTEVRAGAPPRLMGYCVRGNTLTLSPHHDSAATGEHPRSGTFNFMRMESMGHGPKSRFPEHIRTNPLGLDLVPNIATMVRNVANVVRARRVLRLT